MALFHHDLRAGDVLDLSEEIDGVTDMGAGFAFNILFPLGSFRTAAGSGALLTGDHDNDNHDHRNQKRDQDREQDQDKVV